MKAAFEHPSELRFSCSRCGDCCRNANIQVTPAELETLQGLEWRGREEDLVGAEPTVVVPGSGGRRRLRRQEDGACLYLGADNACRLHRHFGAATKPLMCRVYPFSFFPVGERVTVDCAFSCRAISHGLGAPLATHVSDWRRVVADELGEPRSRRHRLNARYPLPDELLWELETYLLELLAERSLSLFDRIRCVLEFTRLATSGDPATASARQLRAALAKGLPRQITKMSAAGACDRSQRALFFQWLYLALNPATANQDLLRGRQLEAEQRRRIGIGNRYQQPQQRPFVDNRELTATFEAIAAVDARFLEADGAVTVESFLRAKILGQRFLQAGEDELPLQEAVPKFLLIHPMAIWTSQALAADRGVAAVGEEDLRQALRLLDRSLGQLATSQLPKKQAKACNFIMLETDFVVRCRNELLGLGGEEEEV